jgi:hypothetical protein
MKTLRPRPPVDAASLYIESWQCLKCDAQFITFCTGNFTIAHRPDQIACPYCHYVGRFRHWQAQLTPDSRLKELFPWPESRNFDTEDAEQRQRRLELSTPSAREYYDRTDLTPWQIDQRPQPNRLPPKHSERGVSR